MLGYTTHAGDDTHVCDTLCLPAWWGLTMYDHHVNDALLGDLRIIHRCLEVPDICHFWQKVLILQTKSCDKKLLLTQSNSEHTAGPECSVPGVLPESLGPLWEHSEKIQRSLTSLHSRSAPTSWDVLMLFLDAMEYVVLWAMFRVLSINNTLENCAPAWTKVSTLEKKYQH